MAASLRQSFGVNAELIKGSGGVFDVRLDDHLIFSKHEAGRFPSNEEIIGLVRDKLR